MGEMVTFNWPMHGQQLCKGIMDLVKENFQTDFKLLVKADDKSGERQIVEVHHLVLAIFCPLLKNMTQKKFNLGNYKIDDLQRLVEFIYTGKTTVNKAGLSRLRRGANAIGLKPLVHSIDTYVRRQKAAKDSQANKQSSQSSGTTAVSPRKPMSPLKSRVAEIKSRLRQTADQAPLKNSRPTKTKLTCKHCSFSADQNYKMVTHMAVVHHLDAEGNKLEKSVKCVQCSFTCYTKVQVNWHQYYKHSKDQFKCDQCPYVCGTKPRMNNHMKTHSEERPLMCEQCGQRFKLLSVYTDHMKRHKGLKANCEVCGKTVALMSLKRHMQLHKSTEKPNMCHLCPFAARERFNLRIHLRGVHKVQMDKQGNVLGKDVHYSAEDECAVDEILNTE